ncbi:MAG: hypothetical protein K6F46_03335 [Desulfovibrio sp.]|nr:hypothetical protein [Desulfovibrio sp.]
MRILHIPERVGRWVEIEWEGSADELMRRAERAEGNLREWERFLSGDNGNSLQDKFIELPAFDGLLFHVGRDGEEGDAVCISDADGRFENGRNFEAEDAGDISCVATQCNGEWYAEISCFVKGGIERGREPVNQTFCWMPFSEFSTHVVKLAEAISQDEKSQAAS